MGAIRLSPRGLPILGVAVLLVIVARLAWMPQGSGPALLVAGYLGAIVVLWQNREHPWLILVLFGLALNTVVMLANGGRMPVAGQALAHAGGIARPSGLHDADARYLAEGPDTRLAALGDSLPVRVGAFGTVLSPGDLLIAGGLAGFVQAQMRTGTSGPA